jgi:peroxiredoxin
MEIQPLQMSQIPLKTAMLGLVGLSLLAIGAVLWVLLPAPKADAGGEAAEYISAIPAQVNFPAPELQLKDLSGDQRSLADLRGQVVLVNNWAFWCAPCLAELPELQAYYQAHQAQGFVLVGVEAGGGFEDVSSHVRQNGLTYPIWLDPQEQALSKFKNSVLPSSYVLDPEGQVVLAWSGPVKRNILEVYVTPLLEK